MTRAAHARRPPVAAATLGLLGLAAAFGLAAGCRSRLGAGGLPGSRAEHARLRAAFDRLAERDPLVTEALAQGGDVVIGVRPALVQSVLGQVAARYLDRVDLDLPLEQQVHEAHDLHVGTFLGRLNAGTWTLDVTIHRVRGTLRAREPRVEAAPGNMLALQATVALAEGHGSATVHFKWESHSVASVVCHDFEVTRNLSGQVLPSDYPVAGGFELTANAERLRAEPRFPPREFRIRVDLTDASWNDVRSAIDEQDQVLRCGLALDSDKLLASLRARLHEGFDVKVPQSLFRPVDFPAALRQEVAIEDRRVDLDVRTRGLAVTPVAVWYGADVRTRVQAAATESPR